VSGSGHMKNGQSVEVDIQPMDVSHVKYHNRREVMMSKATGQPSIVLREVVDLLVENRIKLDALENVVKEINPMLHERYLGEIEVVKERKAPALKQALTASLKAKLTPR
jgi:hypothetical protein